MIHTVYKHENKENGKVYIGITKRKPKRRWKGGIGYKGQDYFYNAIKKYGWDSFEHIIIAEKLTREEAINKEIELIALYDSTDRDKGYNISLGGDYAGKHSEETKKKISELRMGMVFTQEHRENLSKSQKGIIPTEQQNMKNRMNNPNRRPVKCVETGVEYNGIREAGKLTGISHKRISGVCHKKYGHKSAGGFTWKFIEKGVSGYEII